MPEVSIKDQLKKLVEIQTIDKQIYDHKVELEEKPAYIAELKEQFESKKANLQALEEQFKGIQVQRKEKELELQTKEEAISKANADLSQIKTNKEYTAKLTEIENMKADKSRFEETILTSYDEGDKISAKIEEEKKFLDDEEKKYLAQKKEVDDSLKVLEDQVKVFEGKRNQLTPEIDKTMLSQYDRLLNKLQGVAIVPIDGDACGGCYFNVTQQIINEVKMHDKLIVCESCQRILYIEEDL